MVSLSCGINTNCPPYPYVIYPLPKKYKYSLFHIPFQHSNNNNNMKRRVTPYGAYLQTRQ